MADAEFNMKPMIGVMMIAVMASILIPTIGQAAPPTPTYCCPIHERLGEPICFSTYAELETHFTAEHPSIPIDIGWE